MAKVEVTIQLKPSLMDAQGATINKALHNLGYAEVKNVRIGKFIELEVEGTDAPKIEARVREMCEKLLANPIIEDFSVKSTSPNPHGQVREPRAAYMIQPRVEDWRGFQMSVDEYEQLDVQAKGDLHWEFQQFHGDWIEEQLRSRGAKWILVAGGVVVDSGSDWHDCPNDYALAELSRSNDQMYWPFIKFEIEESLWQPVSTQDYYPSLAIEIMTRKPGEKLQVLADFDSGSNATFLDKNALSSAAQGRSFLQRVRKGAHLGSPFEYSILPVDLGLTAESGETQFTTVDCIVVYHWETSPFRQVNPNRQALVGRDVILRLPATIELDGKHRVTRIKDVQP